MAVRVCIVGCGAIGGLYAAHLARLPELEVWAYDIGVEHVDAINRAGLRVSGAEVLLARVNARNDPEQIPACDFGLVATKGTSTASAIAATARPLGTAAVCSLQNGIGNEEVIAEHVARVIRGVTMPAGRLNGPGDIQMDAAGPTWIGPFEPRPAAADEIQRLGELLTRSGMPTHVLGDARGAQWRKLLFNAATNPVCALTGLTHGELCDLPSTHRLARALVAEGRAVADAVGVVLDADPDAMIDEAARVNHDHRPSMLQDVVARQRTEIDTLNGGIVREARAAGCAAPLHKAITDLILGLEQSWTV